MRQDVPLWWEEGVLCLIDQTVLPHQVKTCRCTSWGEVAEAIRTLKVRGAPAIGLAAAYGLALAARSQAGHPRPERLRQLRHAAAELRATRPTAINLAWALDRLLGVAEAAPDAADLAERLLDAAHALARADLDANRRIGAYGAALLPSGARVLTYCNTGMLATGGYGTAFGVLRRAHERGGRFTSSSARPAPSSRAPG
jgi:methylthioribose-1-phosphate isomerase